MNTFRDHIDRKMNEEKELEKVKEIEDSDDDNDLVEVDHPVIEEEEDGDSAGVSSVASCLLIIAALMVHY